MANNMDREPMLEMFIFETFQLIDQLEQSLLDCEKESGFEASINEIFRIMHTIKGSSAMMMFDNISTLAHSIEDLFFFLREEKPEKVESYKIIDLVFEGVDFIKSETAKVENGLEPDGSSEEIKLKVNEYLGQLREANPSKGSSGNGTGGEVSKVDDNPNQKYYVSSDKSAKSAMVNKYEAIFFFEDGCEMENIRAFSVVHDLEDFAQVVSYYPEDVMENSDTAQIIQNNGFKVVFNTDLGIDEVREQLNKTILLKELKLYLTDDALDSFGAVDSKEGVIEQEKDLKNSEMLKNIDLGDLVENKDSGDNREPKGQTPEKDTSKENVKTSGKQNVISVNIGKLDLLMDLVGELVISEAMVTQNPDLEGLELSNFSKAARQLNKITSELQDIVMSIRMVPLSMTFQKMHRIVRDMSKKLDKSVTLEIIGEETEVDKNIIEHISDPLIHLIRNSIDHGIEKSDERIQSGKAPTGKLVLEAKNAGGEVWIIVKDDGKGLDREKILSRARANGIIRKPESELTDREIYSFIFLPGFSTKENVTEFSGRGVGMDIVTKNIEKLGGTVNIDSIPGEGTTFIIKFPLTLAIIDGMIIEVGESKYTIPTVSILESFRVKNEAVIEDEHGNEMIMVRGECYPILRLQKHYRINSSVEKLTDGIMIMVENSGNRMCVFADALLGEQQVVVKALPNYIKKVKGIAGCTLLGNGDISLILDIDELIS